MGRTRVGAAIILGLAVFVLASCAAGPNPVEAGPDAAGFWLGLWHGIIAPVTFIVSLFSDSVNIYEVNNNGGWYNFGFLFGASMTLGGGGAGGARSRR